MEWGIADTHFGHSKIIEYENRPFKNVEEMDRTLINNWNSVVDKRDTVWHLGDFFLTYTERQFEIFDQLNGKIILIRGNHDKQSRTKLIERIGFAEVYDEHAYGDVILSHRPKQPEEVRERRFLLNIHGHKHSVDKQLSHFHYCISAENINYTPVKLGEIINEYRSY